MAFLHRIFTMLGTSPPAPAQVPTDTVIPVFARDDTTAKRNMSLDFTMMFEHELDAEKLSSTLWRLLDRPGWRKLGARLRLNANNTLEYHVPQNFSSDRPPINYSHTLENKALAEHPLGAKIPRASGDRVQVFHGLDEFRDLLAGQDSPKVLADWIYSDRAQLSLHIVNFSDVTFVTIVWLHTLLDGTGLHELINSWIAVLDGREEDVPAFIAYDTDPLATLGSPPDGVSADGTGPHMTEPVLKKLSIRGFAKARFIFNFLWEPFWYPAESACIIALPYSRFAKLKTQAFRDLESLPHEELTYRRQQTSNSMPQPFISDSDIVTAWYMRLYASCNKNIANSSPSRLLNAQNVLDMRNVLRSTAPRLLPPENEGVLTNNCLINIQSLFTVHEMLSLPLGHIAARIRRDLVTQASREQIEASLHFERENGGFFLCGTGDMAVAVISNMTPARFYESDFNSAIVSKNLPHGKKARGKPAYVHIRTTQGGVSAIRGSVICIGKDCEGNWWLRPTLRKEWLQSLDHIVETSNTGPDVYTSNL